MANSTRKTPVKKSKVKCLADITAEIEAQAEANKETRAIKSLSSVSGKNRYLHRKDAETLSQITTAIEDVTGKPVRTGFTYSSNVETIVAIASSLQYMKSDLREQIPSALYDAIDGDTRTELLHAYGRLPYLAEEAVIEVNGETVFIDPEAKQRAKAGIQPDVEMLEALINEIAINLNLLAEYTITQEQADLAWSQAVNRLTKAEKLEEYKDSLVA